MLSKSKALKVGSIRPFASPEFSYPSFLVIVYSRARNYSLNTSASLYCPYFLVHTPRFFHYSRPFFIYGLLRSSILSSAPSDRPTSNATSLFPYHDPFSHARPSSSSMRKIVLAPAGRNRRIFLFFSRYPVMLGAFWYQAPGLLILIFS
jgi:hypothetical protein